MASTVLETLNNIENGRKYCINEAKKVGYRTRDDMSIYDIGDLLSQTPTGEVINGWQRPDDWWDCETILANAEEREGLYPAYILLLADWDKETTFKKVGGSYNNTQGDGFLTSDGAWYVGDATHTWDTTKDKECSEGYKTRYVIVYVANPDEVGFISLGRFPCLEIVGGKMTAQSITFGYSNGNGNVYLKSVVFPKGTNINPTSYTFTCCYALENIYWEELTSTNASYFLSSNYALKNINFPKLETISVSNPCLYALKSANLPSLKTLPLLFSNAYCLETVVLNNVTTISANQAFINCYNLKKIYIPNAISIGSNFLQNCKNIERFDFLSTMTTINITNFFVQCTSLKIINLYNDWAISGLDVSTCVSLTRPCLLDMLDKLKDVTNEENAFTLTLGATNLAKLTEEEIAVGTNKGWVIN